MSAPDISDNDIVFECPLCGQSMAIDQRGAGLVVPCRGCGEDIQVPGPRVGGSGGEAGVASKIEIGRLSATLKELQQQQNALDQLAGENDQRMDVLRKEIEQLQERLKNAQD